MDKKVVDHFKKVDSVLFKAYSDYGMQEITELIKPKDYFRKLCQEIIKQQLSNKVGEVLCSRFTALFLRGIPTPAEVDKLTEDDLRKIGMSYGKARYIKGLAKDILDEKLVLADLETARDTYIVENLTRVKGIGIWTAEMFLIFAIGRENIFSLGDSGLKKAVVNLYNLQNPSKEEILVIANKWSPYKSFACRILWKSLGQI